MAHTIRLNRDYRVVVVRHTGNVNYTELRSALAEVPQICGFEEGLRLVADFRASNAPLSAEEVRLLASYAKGVDARWGETKWAIIAADDVIYGLARMYSALTNDHRVETFVFRNPLEADDWLGLGIGMEELLKQTPE